MTKEELQEAAEERTQERLAKSFAKRARMCRLEEMYAESQEFSQQRMIDEDESMKKELSQMTVSLTAIFHLNWELDPNDVVSTFAEWPGTQPKHIVQELFFVRFKSWAYTKAQ